MKWKGEQVLPEVTTTVMLGMRVGLLTMTTTQMRLQICWRTTMA
jgi:hypothetical protein